MGSFGLLARHFFGRFFDNEIVSQQGDMRTNVIQVLGFLAVPPMFAAFAMLPAGLNYARPFDSHKRFLQRSGERVRHVLEPAERNRIGTVELQEAMHVRLARLGSG